MSCTACPCRRSLSGSKRASAPTKVRRQDRSHRPPDGQSPKLGRRRFLVLRSVLFPRNRDTLADVTARSIAVDDGVRRLAERYSAGRGFLRRRLVRLRSDSLPVAALVDRLAAVSERTCADLGSQRRAGVGGLVRASRLNLELTPRAILDAEERSVLGVTQRRRQPCVTYADGTRRLVVLGLRRRIEKRRSNVRAMRYRSSRRTHCSSKRFDIALERFMMDS